MPKDTFYNLNKEKQERIIACLKEVFKNKTIFEANVKEIVEKLDIARGSFYQYFEDLEDAYFMLLDLETVDIHKLFAKILQKNSYEVFSSLEEYGEQLRGILFLPENYSIYKNKYLYWTPDLEKEWKDYKRKQKSTHPNLEKREESLIQKEEMHFIKAVVHNLIQRMYLEEWSEEEFSIHFKQYLHWLKEGVKI